MQTNKHFLAIGRIAGPSAEVDSDRNLYRIGLVTAGGIEVSIAEERYTCGAGTIHFAAPGQAVQYQQRGKELDGYLLSFDIDYFLLCLKNQVQLCFYPFFQTDGHPLLRISKSQSEKVRALISRIEIEYNSRQGINDDLLTKLYLNILLIELERLYKQQVETAATGQTRQQLITARFKQLVEQHFLTVRKVSAYADMLHMAPGYLNDVVKERTGLPASALIYERIIMEAKAQLIQTESSVSEIAYQLGFYDSSYFCRFYKKHTGLSPQQYRRSNHF